MLNYRPVDEDDLEDLWRGYQTRPKHVYQGLTRDGYYYYLLTPWCRVLEKLTGLQLVKKFPAFHRTRRFITALTSIRQLSLSWVSPIQSVYPHSTSWRSIPILSTHLRLGLPSGLLTSGFPSKTLHTPPSPRPYAPHAQPINFLPILSPAQYCVRSTMHVAPRYIIIIIIIRYGCLLSQAFCSWYFSWTSGDPHCSGFKLHTAVLSVLCVMFQV